MKVYNFLPGTLIVVGILAVGTEVPVSIASTISVSRTNTMVLEGSGLAAVVVERSGDISQSASVRYDTKDGTAFENVDYLPSHGRLEFGPLETEKTISIEILDDGIPGADTCFSLHLSDPGEGTSLKAGASTITVEIADSQRPGSVDFSFHPLIETTNVSPQAFLGVRGYRIALQPDSKLIVGGDFQHVNGMAHVGICRLNTDGSLDPSFEASLGSSDGVPGGDAALVYSLALQPDGKILVRGLFTSVNDASFTNFVRLNANGSVDTGFVPDSATLSLSYNGKGAAMAVQKDGKILVAEGDCCATEPARLARLNADGSADAGFVTLQVVGTEGGWGSTFKCIVLDGDGRALFEGNTDSSDPFVQSPQKGLTRLNANDEVDTTFHPIMDRLAVTDTGTRTTAIVQPDGKIVTGGFFTTINGIDRPGLARLNPDGSTDLSFAPAARSEGAPYYVNALARQPNGKIVVALADGSVLRLNEDGSPDMTFDFRNDQQEIDSALFSEMFIQPDGQIVLATLVMNRASGTGGFRLRRLNGDKYLAVPRASFRSITRLSGGMLQLELNTSPNRLYMITSAEDLIHWTLIGVRRATNYVMGEFLSRPNSSREFFRAVEVMP